MRAHARTAWLPLTQPGESSTTLDKFGGAGWFLPRTRHPSCKSCRAPMSLGLQLRLSTLPPPFLATLRTPVIGAEFLQSLDSIKDIWKLKYDVRRLHTDAVGEGLFQHFICKNDACLCESGITLTSRVLPASDCRPRSSADDLPARTITGWREIVDLPHAVEWKRLGIHLPEEIALRLEDDLDPPDERDKLGGWPHWEQSVAELHRCHVPWCCDGRPPDFLFQIASNENLPLGFGDEGKAYLFFSACSPPFQQGVVQYG